MDGGVCQIAVDMMASIKSLGFHIWDAPAAVNQFIFNDIFSYTSDNLNGTRTRVQCRKRIRIRSSQLVYC